jgi:hypothetical protein
MARKPAKARSLSRLEKRLAKRARYADLLVEQPQAVARLEEDLSLYHRNKHERRAHAEVARIESEGQALLRRQRKLEDERMRAALEAERNTDGITIRRIESEGNATQVEVRRMKARQTELEVGGLSVAHDPLEKKKNENAHIRARLADRTPAGPELTVEVVIRENGDETRHVLTGTEEAIRRAVPDAGTMTRWAQAGVPEPELAGPVLGTRLLGTVTG